MESRINALSPESPGEEEVSKTLNFASPRVSAPAPQAGGGGDIPDTGFVNKKVVEIEENMARRDPTFPGALNDTPAMLTQLTESPDSQTLPMADSSLKKKIGDVQRALEGKIAELSKSNTRAANAYSSEIARLEAQVESLKSAQDPDAIAQVLSLIHI